ncbi:hypothetical protein BGW36DRAFT_363584 [Talaromyces proteolyticus]|uniref:Uncharacterized protein n=1 Tax=Talaromyces proteolyticus TaxID=1131652 RepID=A0AAD4KIP0_9EURO|nr:uncharacterized protein BGW36DRAFT_363584 [Talaromyces proteolyticus]KAH8691248.1 hypothetical protein BGW36DRAFT_363584 [Talaromyces proteolyticus]
MTIPKVSVFSLPLAPWQQNASVRVEKYDQKHGLKRRRSRDGFDGEDHDQADTKSDAASEINPSQGPALVLSPGEAHQYRIAGLALDQKLPGGYFPHASGNGQDRKRSDRFYLEELSNQSPPIFLPGSNTVDSTLHLRHLGALTTILHRCLLDGDFTRAGRAWGMLLRERVGGRPIDLRQGGRWGIGAEILFRQGTGEPLTQSLDTHPKRLFSRQGFQAAKAYYEGLIIQYPYLKTLPSMINATDFYPAMFSLWIYFVDTESRNAREAIENEEDDDSSFDNFSEPGDISMSDLEGRRGNQDWQTSMRIANIRSKELSGALEIEQRMDEILISPPYIDMPVLLKLRGMVALWVGDLFVSSQPDPDADTSILETVQSSQLLFARRELRVAKEKREIERSKADKFFEKARMREEIYM